MTHGARQCVWKQQPQEPAIIWQAPLVVLAPLTQLMHFWMSRERQIGQAASREEVGLAMRVTGRSAAADFCAATRLSAVGDISFARSRFPSMVSSYDSAHDKSIGVLARRTPRAGARAAAGGKVGCRRAERSRGQVRQVAGP